jgi:hypothetical protein
MQKQDGEIAHRQSDQDRDTGKECSRILEFAMHSIHARAISETMRTCCTR